MNHATEKAAELTPLCEAHDADHHPIVARPNYPGAVIDRAAAMLSAAGDPARLRLLHLLAAGERCVSEVAAHSGDAMPTVSQRLQLLRREGLLTSRKDGKHVFYRLADQHVLELVDNVLRHAGEGR
jgi:DNA-binding transcriptional ArsR family regulator